MSDVVYQPDTKMEKLAHNYTLQVFARVCMVLFGGLGMPIVVIVGVAVSDSLAKLRDGMFDLRTSINITKSEVLNLKTLHEYQLRSFDDRLSAQSRRMDSLDSRFERLERPFFDGRGK